MRPSIPHATLSLSIPPLCFHAFGSPSPLTHRAVHLLIYSTLNQGVSSHKKIPKEQSWILRQYYGNNIVLFLFCACNELFFVSIYLLSFPPPPNSPPRLGKSPSSRTHVFLLFRCCFLCLSAVFGCRYFDPRPLTLDCQSLLNPSTHPP